MQMFNGCILTEERAQEFLDKGIWKNESFVDVLEKHANLYPDLVHKDENRSLTYAELWNEVQAVAANLYHMGIRKGDTVALQLTNTLDYVVALFGANLIGAAGVSLQVDLGREALVKSINQAKAKAWIITDNYRGQPLYDMAVEVKSSLPSIEHLIIQGTQEDKYSEATTFSSLKTAQKPLTEEELNANRPGPLDKFLLVFTSGTTGSPKGVVHLHANYLWASRVLAKNFGYEAGDGVLDIAPIFHQTGMLAGVMMTIAAGGRILFIDRFSANRVLKWIETEKPGFIIGAPPHVIHVANSPKLAESDTSSVKVFIYAGAPVPSSILHRLQTDGGIKIGGMFGWSEGFVACATKPNDPIEAISSTVGFGLPGLEIRLVDEEGNDVNEGEPGEMLARGPNFSAGYYENPEASHKQWDEDGWFHSGDLLRKDKDGRYAFIARADDIINRGGTKVDPKAVEDVIAALDAVETVAVVGAPHDTLGQQTVACVVLKEDAEPFTHAELRDFLKEKGLAKFQFPDKLEILKELPMTPSGKIKKIVLREQFLVEAQSH
ncbi:acyl-CoA synthetase (AMP-forming)/AMP-acid ligase II [Pullulanibacillus pueri]|uniref:AMP-binding protein n=1 Tax=Pullulanibacillus pueri TaxID=1437324 RepID=A0A8J2ZUE3_9BACL|nr:class I adenylate-forming enzyme family protein [Pullulanibacillus pueri]MBM7681060.1 acyl-CoA synthetase (AMP-forming)/AMP-acid ligase II [Pullulanibacillus pueri]GGH76889.1 AMP-binding protein [Pullulanibacillus pueri]